MAENGICYNCVKQTRACVCDASFNKKDPLCITCQHIVGYHQVPKYFHIIFIFVYFPVVVMRSFSKDDYVSESVDTTVRNKCESWLKRQNINKWSGP